MRSRNNNLKAKNVTQNVLRGAGITSVGVLTLLGILAISPIINKADAANGWDEELKNYRETASTVTLSMDSGTNSVVNAGNTNTNVGVVKRTASVTLGNTNGYSVYIRANSANLTGSSSSNTIPSVTSNSTLSQMTDKWGWNGNIGDSVTDCSLSDVFKQMTTSNQTLGTGGAVSSGTKKITMCFGTRVSEAKVADTYSNTVTLSVVAQPGRVGTFNNITTMQAMTPAICSAADYHDTAQLEDARDGKKYWVTKMLDGNCWMSQNLALNIDGRITASSNDGTTFEWSGGHMATGAEQSGITSNNGTYAWALGDYVITNPSQSSSCSGGNVGPSACADRFTAVNGKEASTDPSFYKNNGNKTSTATEYDAHYLAGNLYQWNAATAGTGASTDRGDAPGSICPKNWRLPTSATDDATITSGTYAYLLQKYGLISAYNSGAISGNSPVNGNAYNVTLSPLSFVRSGFAASSSQIGGAGAGGNYWSSMGYNTGESYSRAIDPYIGHAYSLEFDSSLSPYVPYTYRYYGYSLRCFLPVL